MMNRSMQAVLLLATIVAAGCGGKSPQFESRPTFPVEGMVLVRGKPAEGVQVFFHPRNLAQQGKPRGVTDAAGKFQLRTYRDGDGAPEGEYTVTFYWPGPHKAGVAVEDQMPPDRLGERFLDPKGSSLRARVAPGPTQLPPFELR